MGTFLHSDDVDTGLLEGASRRQARQVERCHAQSIHCVASLLSKHFADTDDEAEEQ